MTKNELIEKLREMRAEAPRGELTAMTQLFGILFDREIRAAGTNGAEVGRGADIGNVEINDGRKLASFVDPKPSVKTRWKPGPRVAGSGGYVPPRDHPFPGKPPLEDY